MVKTSEMEAAIENAIKTKNLEWVHTAVGPIKDGESVSSYKYRVAMAIGRVGHKNATTLVKFRDEIEAREILAERVQEVLNLAVDEYNQSLGIGVVDILAKLQK